MATIHEKIDADNLARQPQFAVAAKAFDAQVKIALDDFNAKVTAYHGR
jgi:hypothetical protein